MHRADGAIAIVGVGGTGVLKASELLAYYFLAEGLEVRQSEVHGMAQRGGSVITHLRYGRGIYSPLLQSGEADYMLALEEMEALRYAFLLKKGAHVFIDQWRLLPPALGTAVYPQDVAGQLTQAGFRVVSVPAHEKAVVLGFPRLANTVLVGAFSAILPSSCEKEWENAIYHVFPSHLVENNLLAFREGRAYPLRVRLDKSDSCMPQ